jgi:DNA-binding NtrC family response regulator
VSRKQSRGCCQPAKHVARRKEKYVKKTRPALMDAKPYSPTLVWIDDYEPGLAVYKSIYEHFGYQVHTASHGSEGLEILASRKADAVIVDYEMPGMDGGIVAKSIKERWPSLPVIMFSGHAAVPSHVTGMVDAFCDKAGAREDLHLAIRTVLQKRTGYIPTTSFNAVQPGRLAAV